MKQKRILLIILGIVVILIAAPLLFFYVTTRMESPKVFKVSAEPDTQREKINQDSSVTVIITNTNEFIFFKNKSEIKKGSLTDFRTFLVREDVAKRSFTVMIVPMEGSSYKSTVDILDEMQINNIMKYALVDAKEEDIAIANKTN